MIVDLPAMRGLVRMRAAIGFAFAFVARACACALATELPAGAWDDAKAARVRAYLERELRRACEYCDGNAKHAFRHLAVERVEATGVKEADIMNATLYFVQMVSPHPTHHRLRSPERASEREGRWTPRFKASGVCAHRIGSQAPHRC